MENEVDLKKYLDILLKRWLVIVSITVVAGLIATLVSFLMPSTYEAQASVLVVKTRTELVLEPQYLTALEMDGEAQRQALITLGKSSSVANNVIALLGDDASDQTAESLLRNVKISENGDLVEISYKSTNASKAAMIANAWGDAYAAYINDLYSGISLSLEELDSQVLTSLAEYNRAQTAFEDFIGDNDIDETTRKIADKQLLIQVKSLRDQIAANPTSTASIAANNLAVILLQTSAFTTLPETLQITTDQLHLLTTNTADVNDLISTLETRSRTTPGSSAAVLQSEIIQLQKELEQEESTKQELQSARDTAWDVHTVFNAKYDEVELDTLVQEAVVKTADIAIVPTTSIAPRRMTNIAIALVIGFIAGVLVAFGIEYYKNSNGEKDTEGKHVNEQAD